MSFFGRALPSLVTFFVGVGAMYIANLLITRHASVDVTAEWATLNAFMMVGGTFALFGFDQQLVREPHAAKLIAKTSVFNILIVASIAGVVGYQLDYIPSILVGTIVVIGFAASAMSFQWWRSNLRMTAAYLSNGTWRLVFLLGVAILFVGHGTPLSTLLIGAFLIGFILILGLFASVKPKDNLTSIHSDIKGVKDIYFVGSSYFMAGLSLAIASYAESLVVRTLGEPADVALYFTSIILFLFPGVMFNQYIAAVVGPALRQNEARAISLLRRYWLLLILALIIIWPGLLAVGFILGKIVYGSVQTPLALAALLSLTSCVRLVYILPSNFVGITANKKQLREISALFLLFALLFPLMAWGFHEAGLAVIFAVAIANLINWTLRAIAGLSIMKERFALYPARVEGAP